MTAVALLMMLKVKFNCKIVVKVFFGNLFFLNCFSILLEGKIPNFGQFLIPDDLKLKYSFFVLT